MYKLTRPDGYDFYSGTINYREAIGTIIRVTDFDPPQRGSCGKGLHASKKPNDCFVGAKIPCAAFKVQGIGRIAGDKQKTRYKAIKVLEELHDLDSLFCWKYSEATKPIHPFRLTPPEITETHIKLVTQWASVRASVRDSVREFVEASVGASVREFVGASVRDSMEESVRNSVRDSVRDSVEESVEAYIGSLFPNIKKWKYINHKKGEYPFQSAVDLWKQGLLVSFDGTKYRLHGGEKADILWVNVLTAP